MLNRAEEQPQVITRRGRRFVVVDSDAFARLTGATPKLKDVILHGPSLEGVDLARDTSSRRADVTL